MSSLPHTRLCNQQIAASRFSSPAGLVAWMGAMQAQDYPMVRWAVGLRVPGATETTIHEALARGEILRTHVLRPTWHLLAAADIRWMLELTAPHIRSANRARMQELELTPEVLSRSRALIEKNLRDGHHLTRQDLMQAHEQAGIPTHDNRSAHLMMAAELDGLVCSGIDQGNQQTYALLEERAPHARTMPREEALAELALRYFRSHGPATLRDFIWWSGLPVGDARHALEMVKPRLVAVQQHTDAGWMDAEHQTIQGDPAGLYLLPAFDEYLISYQDRSAILPPEHFQKAVSSNGVFRPIVVVDGKIRGLWTRSFKKNQAVVGIQLFDTDDPAIRELIREKAKDLGAFWGKEVVV
jgi:hypothetical protein